MQSLWPSHFRKCQIKNWKYMFLWREVVVYSLTNFKLPQLFFPFLKTPLKKNSCLFCTLFGTPYSRCAFVHVSWELQGQKGHYPCHTMWVHLQQGVFLSVKLPRFPDCERWSGLWNEDWCIHLWRGGLTQLRGVSALSRFSTIPGCDPVRFPGLH